jgi:hypothetical protein
LHSPFDDWLAKLEKVSRPAPMPVPSHGVLRESLSQLRVSPQDAEAVLATMPAPDRDPEPWSLLQRSHHLLSQGLAHRSNNAEPLPALPPSFRFFPVHLILATLPEIRECHRHFGIPDDISTETLAHVGQAMSEYRAQHKEPGIQLTRWNWMRYCGWLYQVGRLTAIPYRLRSHPEAGPLFWYDEQEASRRGPGFHKGDTAVSVHIPPTEPLKPDAVDESIRRMSTAFDRVFPGEPPRVATCTSWLLDDQLAEYLPPDSNILAFQRRFELAPGARDDDNSFLLFVFGPDRPKNIDALPQRTTLERAAVQHLKQGRHWRMRTGWLAI